MIYSIDENEGVLTISLSGSADITGLKDFSAEVNSICSEKKSDIEIDMSAVEYIDSTFISVLLKLHKSQSQKKLGFKIVKASPKVTSVLNLCSLSGTLIQ